MLHCVAAFLCFCTFYASPTSLVVFVENFYSFLLLYRSPGTGILIHHDHKKWLLTAHTVLPTKASAFTNDDIFHFYFIDKDSPGVAISGKDLLDPTEDWLHYESKEHVSTQLTLCCLKCCNGILLKYRFSCVEYIYKPLALTLYLKEKHFSLCSY